MDARKARKDEQKRKKMEKLQKKAEKEAAENLGLEKPNTEIKKEEEKKAIEPVPESKEEKKVVPEQKIEIRPAEIHIEEKHPLPLETKKEVSPKKEEQKIVIDESKHPAMICRQLFSHLKQYKGTSISQLQEEYEKEGFVKKKIIQLIENS